MQKTAPVLDPVISIPEARGLWYARGEIGALRRFARAAQEAESPANDEPLRVVVLSLKPGSYSFDHCFRAFCRLKGLPQAYLDIVKRGCRLLVMRAVTQSLPQHLAGFLDNLLGLLCQGMHVHAFFDG